MRYLWDILRISWGYLRDIFGIYKGYLGDIFRDILGISWGYLCRSVPPEFLRSFFNSLAPREQIVIYRLSGKAMKHTVTVECGPGNGIPPELLASYELQNMPCWQQNFMDSQVSRTCTSLTRRYKEDAFVKI